MEETMHTLPESALMYLVELWCRSRGEKPVNIGLHPPGTLAEDDLKNVEIIGRKAEAG